MADSPVMEIRSVSKSFGRIQAVRDVSLTVRQGEFVALLGPNGAGKTTLIEMLEGIQTPTAGSITLLGMNWRDHRKALGRKVGFALQETRLVDKLTVLETLRLFASFYDIPDSRCDEVLKRFDLEGKSGWWIVHLSGGQRQRLALALGVLQNPAILFLDEPSTGLDPHARAVLWEQIRQLRSEGLTLILTTHYMEEAEALCDRIVILDNGSILADGALEDLLFADGIRAELRVAMANSETATVAAKRWEKMSAIAGNVHLTDNELSADLRETGSMAALLSGIADLPITAVSMHKRNLNDLFLRKTGRSLTDA